MPVSSLDNVSKASVIVVDARIDARSSETMLENPVSLAESRYKLRHR
jgi:hypothetical protein